MKKAITIAVALAATTISAQAQAGAAAVCIEIDTNSAGNRYDAEFFARWGKSPNVDGFTALRAAKRDHRRSYPSGTPYCRHTGSDRFPDGGFYVLIKDGREKDSAGAHYNRWAMGFGIDRTQAIIDAKKELRRRDPTWRERTHSYKMVEEEEI